MVHKDSSVRQHISSLPSLVTSPGDVGRLLHELALVDNTLLQLSLRADATSATKIVAEAALPKISRLLDQTIELNQLNLLQIADRTVLRQFLETIRKQSPVLHMSFSADPTPAFVEKVVIWLRQEIHPLVLLTIGLQPTIGVGCILRSASKQFDFSLRQDFIGKRQLLLDTLLPSKLLSTMLPLPAPSAQPTIHAELAKTTTETAEVLA